MAKVAPRSEPWTIETKNTIDMTPWAGAKWASIVLVILVVSIYASFNK